MSANRWCNKALIAILLCVGGVLTGCADSEPTPRRMSEAEIHEFREAWNGGGNRTAVSKVQSTAVASGTAPVAFITTYACSAWVVDNTGRKWGPLNVPPNTLIRVAPKAGVAIGEKTFPGDPGAGTYTIHISTPEK